MRGYVQMPSPAGPRWSVAFWMKADGDPPSIYETTVWTLGIDPEDQIQFVLTNDLRLVLEQRGRESQHFQFFRRPPSVADLAWHHVRLTVSPAEVVVYFDGREVGRERLLKPLSGDNGTQRAWERHADGWWRRPDGVPGEPVVVYRFPAELEQGYRWLGNLRVGDESGMRVPVIWKFQADDDPEADHPIALALPEEADLLRVEFRMMPY